jgi:paxillin
VEKDNYAWCINCHTNRYSAKCKKCRKPVTETVVKALGAEWHEHCFACTECGGQFNDGRYFLRPGRETEPFCPACEERRLKA